MLNQGISLARLESVVSPANRQLLSSNTAPLGFNLTKIQSNIASLNKFDTKCILVQLGELESNTTSNLVSVGNPSLGTFTATINANTIISHWGTYYANVATVTITNSDNSNIKIGMVANTISSSIGAFGINSTVIKKSVSGIVEAGNFIPGFTYTIDSVGTTDFITLGAYASEVGNVFVANGSGSGTGTAIGTNNEILLTSPHTSSGDITFTVSPLKLGKYQFSEWFLIKYGYLNTDGTWTGKDNIDNRDLFLQATDLQDTLMRNFIQENYGKLIKSSAIRDGDDKKTVAGMLSLAYQYQDLGNPDLAENIYNSDGSINLTNYSIETKANIWRNTGQITDSQGRPGHIYFNAGRYAITGLGADVVVTNINEQ